MRLFSLHKLHSKTLLLIPRAPCSSNYSPVFHSYSHHHPPPFHFPSSALPFPPSLFRHQIFLIINEPTTARAKCVDLKPLSILPASFFRTTPLFPHPTKPVTIPKSVSVFILNPTPLLLLFPVDTDLREGASARGHGKEGPGRCNGPACK